MVIQQTETDMNDLINSVTLKYVVCKKNTKNKIAQSVAGVEYPTDPLVI